MPQERLSPALYTDLYELTMAQAYWQSGNTAEATFSLFLRNYPPNRAYFVLAGLHDVLEYLEHLRFSDADIAYLRSLGQFDDSFLDYLGELRFTGSVRAMEEGALFFVDEPAIEISGPVIEAQVLETCLLNQITLQSMLATKASRVVHVARGRNAVDFAARRTQGTDAANKLARVSYMVGFAGTSNMLAGGLYGIPTFGTMAHSFVTTFEDEIGSFRAYAQSFPDASTFLVDTYDTIEGTRKAIEVAREMRRRGHSLRGIRLDSGDLLDLSLRTRALLDEAGFQDVQVFASGGLDEYEVDALLSAGAPIDAFGVGTKVGVSADAPWLDTVYKLVQYAGHPVLKLSPHKETLPGPKQVYRLRDAHGRFLHDTIACSDEDPPEASAEPLLREVMRDGRPVARLPDLKELRERFKREFARLPDEHKAIRSPRPYQVDISEGLKRLRSQVTLEVRRHELGGASPRG